jgi:hypothetical protein
LKLFSSYYFLGASARFDDIIRSGRYCGVSISLQPCTPTRFSFFFSCSIAPDTKLEIHVEHCANCESHATTTKHIPGQYDKAFAALSSAVEDAIGDIFPVEIISNPNFRPRVGAFEVDLIFSAKVRDGCVCIGMCVCVDSFSRVGRAQL